MVTHNTFHFIESNGKIIRKTRRFFPPPDSIDDPLALFDKIYDKPWTRLGPYFVGMAIGWILFKTECKIKMNTVSSNTKRTVFIIILMATSVFAFHLISTDPSVGARVFYTSRLLQLAVVTGWTISSAMLGSLIFGLHQVELHPIAAAAYSSLSHTLWALCLSWTVIACATGHGGKLL